jgi:DNA-binding beta-propeller fold protein YncE
MTHGRHAELIPSRSAMVRRAGKGMLVAASVSLAAGACGGSPSDTTGSGGQATTTSSTTTSSAPDLGTTDEIMTNLPLSCAFTCSGCAEPDEPFSCPTLKPWSELPHDAVCGTWDGTYPAPGKGKCQATLPTGEAARVAGPIPGGVVLPDGHRIVPAGRDVVFDDADLKGGFPMSITPLTGTKLALVSDGGIQDNALRLVDLDLLASGGAAEKNHIGFSVPKSLFYGVAWLPPDKALASGGGDGKIYGFTVDVATGTLSRDTTLDIDVGAGDNGTYYVGPIAVSADASKVLVAPSDHADELRVYSLLPAPSYGTLLATVPLGSRTVFDLRADPFDPTGNLYYATDTAGSRLLSIDLAQGAVTRAVDLAKNPAQLVFLDAANVAVASSDGDEIAIVDRAAGAVVTEVPVFEKDAPHGFSPSALAYDPTSQRLYATLAGVNAVEVYDVGPGSPPTLTIAGRIPTAWWPTGVMVEDDGSLVVIAGKGHGVGTDNQAYTWGHGPITSRMRGSIQHVPASALADLAAQTAIVDQGHDLAALPGHPTVDCPAGASDFPVPLDNTSGPSSLIKRVILVVRENKTYDAVFGDRKDLGDGDPSLIMASDTETQGKIWQNARLIAEKFTNFDNFYTDAEQSIQGHTWTAYGRTTDFMERTWLTIWGRATRAITTPTSLTDTPAEGAIFQWLTGSGVSVENMGEIIGGFGLDTQYPGLVYAQNRPDVDKSCYIGGRIRLYCDLKSFTYVVQANDHTYGGAAGAAAPEVMIAVNDEASGLLLDALSHSPIWKDSLLIITEDDPQDGGDHVDLHRSLLLMASPWIKRGYVSHGHYDMASVYKLVAHLFGVPYHNDMIRSAMVPFDAFTSTPDYTPFTYLPRSITAPCNKSGTKQAKEAEGWDFDDLDDQPGLSRQIMEMMREPRAARGVRIVR